MTADERIERLLNEAGQTIMDLRFFYTAEQREAAKRATRERMRSGLFVTAADYQDMICHQAAVIDRMEWAVDSLLKRMPRHSVLEDDEHRDNVPAD